MWHLLVGKLYVADLVNGKNGQITLWHQDQTISRDRRVVTVT